MIVKVAKLGDIVREVMLGDRASVEDALNASKITIGSEDEDIRLNNSVVSLSHSISDGDIITIIPQIKGGR